MVYSSYGAGTGTVTCQKSEPESYFSKVETGTVTFQKSEHEPEP